MPKDAWASPRPGETPDSEDATEAADRFPLSVPEMRAPRPPGHPQHAASDVGSPAPTRPSRRISAVSTSGGGGGPPNRRASNMSARSQQAKAGGPPGTAAGTAAPTVAVPAAGSATNGASSTAPESPTASYDDLATSTALARIKFNPRKFLSTIAVINAGDVARMETVFSKPPEQRANTELAEVDHLLEKFVEFVRKVPQQQRIRLYRRAKLVTLAAGEILFRQGDIGDTFFIILDGLMDVVVNAGVGVSMADLEKLNENSVNGYAPNIVNTLGPMQTFGEMALLNPNARRAASVIAAEPSLIIGIRGADYVAVMEEWHSQHIVRIAWALRQCALCRLWTEDQVLALASRCTSEFVVPEQVLVKQNRAVSQVWVIVMGACSLVRKISIPDRLAEILQDPSAAISDTAQLLQTPDGAAAVLEVGECRKFDIIGFTPAVQTIASRVSAVAQTRMEVVKIERDVLMQALDSVKDVGLAACLEVDSALIPSDDKLLHRLAGTAAWNKYKSSMLDKLRPSSPPRGQGPARAQTTSTAGRRPMLPVLPLSARRASVEWTLAGSQSARSSDHPPRLKPMPPPKRPPIDPALLPRRALDSAPQEGNEQSPTSLSLNLQQLPSSPIGRMGSPSSRMLVRQITKQKLARTALAGGKRSTRRVKDSPKLGRRNPHSGGPGSAHTMTLVRHVSRSARETHRLYEAFLNGTLTTAQFQPTTEFLKTAAGAATVSGGVDRQDSWGGRAPPSKLALPGSKYGGIPWLSSRFNLNAADGSSGRKNPSNDEEESVDSDVDNEIAEAYQDVFGED